MSILELLILALRFYLLTVAVTLLLQMLTTLRSQIHGIPLGDHELLNTIILAIFPGGNLVIAFDNLIMLFRSKRVFVIRYLFVRNRLGNVTLMKNEDEEEDKEC